MKKDNAKPPEFARRFLRWFLRDNLAEEVSGDLEERFTNTRIKKGVFSAKLDYCYQVMHYMRPFAVRKTRSLHLNQYAMYQSYFRIGWRNLLKNKGYSLINIGGLALGMGLAILVGLWVFDEFSFNKYHENYSTIAQVKRKEVWNNEVIVNTQHVTGAGTLLKTDYSRHFKRVVMVSAGPAENVLAFGDKKFTQSGYYMQPEGAEMFTLKMKYGTRSGLEDMKSILLSESLAEKIFGDVDPVNEVITMDAKRDLRVTGVYEDLPKNSFFREATFFAPLDLYLDGWASLTAWDNYHMYIYVQTQPGADVQKISAEIKDIALPHVRKEVADTKPEFFLQPMREWRLYSEYENGVSVTSRRMKFVWFFIIIGAFVLLLACINFMNLSTARSEKRAREVGIRKSIGSLRSQLVHQFFGESLLVAFISFVLSILLVLIFLPGAGALADKTMALPWNSWKFWLACIGFTLFTGLLAGSYPALYLSSFNPVSVLKGTFKTGNRAKLPRRILVVVQFTVSISLVIGTIVVYQQIQYVKDRPVGYSRNGLIELLPRSPEYFGKYDLLRSELKKTGVVEEMAEADYSVTSTLGWNSGFEWKGKPTGHDPSFNMIRVTPEYGKTIGWQFVKGRDFSRDVASDQAGMIINESALKVMGLEDPVGEIIPWRPDGVDRGTFKVLGVIKDMVKGSPYEPVDPAVIVMAQQDQGWLYIRLDSSVSASQALPKIQTVFSSIVPSAPFDYKFIDDEYDAKFKSEERVGKTAGVLSTLAILISCSGLFGLASFVAEQRTKEISIRKILGASITSLWHLISKEFIALVLISCLIAIPLTSSFMEQWLQQYDYRVSVGWYVFVVTCGGAFVVTLITVSFQAIKAALTNPVNSLKTE